MAGSVSSLEGFSPGSHGGETNYYGAAGQGAGGWLGRREACYEDKEEEWLIPWVLIPITGPSVQSHKQICAWLLAKNRIQLNSKWMDNLLINHF